MLIKLPCFILPPTKIILIEFHYNNFYIQRDSYRYTQRIFSIEIIFWLWMEVGLIWDQCLSIPFSHKHLKFMRQRNSI